MSKYLQLPELYHPDLINPRSQPVGPFEINTASPFYPSQSFTRYAPEPFNYRTKTILTKPVSETTVGAGVFGPFGIKTDPSLDNDDSWIDSSITEISEKSFTFIFLVRSTSSSAFNFINPAWNGIANGCRFRLLEFDEFLELRHVNGFAARTSFHPGIEERWTIWAVVGEDTNRHFYKSDAAGNINLVETVAANAAASGIFLNQFGSRTRYEIQWSLLDETTWTLGKLQKFSNASYTLLRPSVDLPLFPTEAVAGVSIPVIMNHLRNQGVA